MENLYSFIPVLKISGLRRLFSLIFLLMLAGPLLFLCNGQVITTDKSDYAPGETVIITGSGWTAGETVNLHFEKVPPATGPLDLKAVADAAGFIRNAEYIVLTEDIGVTFTVTATGLASGLTATTTFTDAAGSTNKVYQHWADQGTLEWNNNILSANKSDYFEGEVIPHVFVYKASNQTPLTNGSSYSFNITYNYYQDNTNAGGFAFITTYNISRQPGPNDATNPYIAPTEDAVFTNAGGSQGSFYTVDADITNVSAVTYSGTGTKDGHVTVTFTYTGITTTNGIAEIYYGLFISKPGQVPDQGQGPTLGAHLWTGGSLQTTIDIGGSGATSIQLNPDAIIAGKISGYKWNDLDANGVKDGTETFLQGWTIQLSSDAAFTNIIATATTDANGYFEFSVTPDADKSDPDNDPYYVREVLQSGWTQTAPASVYYGPLTITALTPQYTSNNFGNRFCTDLTLTCSTAKSIGPCITQASLDADFATWKSGFSYSGGTTPVSVVYSLTLDGTAIDLKTLSPPSLCGGTVTVYAKATDGCGQIARCSSTYTVNAPPAVVITKAVDKSVKACDLADQTAADAMFAEWLKTATVSGGCKPTSTPDVTTAPPYCGGNVKVTWTIADQCYTSSSYSATFTIDAPAAIVVTPAVDKKVNSCDIADQAAADALFADWLKTASVSGGCKPTSTPDITTAPAYCGGNVKVTWTIADQCYAPTTYSATFTIDAPPAVIITKAADKTISACDVPDQAAADKLFADWLMTASVSGGCKPTSTPDITTGPAYCGGNVKVTWTIADKCYTGEGSYSATFTITAPPAVVITKAADKTVSACDVPDQAAADKLFADWLMNASASGGCKPTSTPDVTAAPAYCGGSVKVTWTIADHCYTGEASYSATFTIIAPPDVIVTKAVDKIINACDVADQAAADKLFADWLMTAKISGGCDPKLTPDITYGPEYCGGSVKVTWTITDKCYTGESSYSAIFAITPSSDVNITKAVDKTVNACDIVDQAGADKLFADWLMTASVSGGCKPTSTPDITKAPAYCGGSVKVTWTIADHCYTGEGSYSAIFTINPPAPVVVTKAADKTISACEVPDQAAADKLFADWLMTASVSGGCKPTSSPDITTGPAYCGGDVKVTWTIADQCYFGESSYSATFSIKAPPEIIVNMAVNKTVNSCALADQAAADAMFAEWLKTASVSGGCDPKSVPDVTKGPDYCGGSVKVDWTVTDHCISVTTYSATFTVEAPSAVIVTKAADKTISSCTIADQAAADAMFAEWLKTASVSGGCDPKSVPDVTKGPDYCGGSVKVTWTITDHCYAPTTYSAIFTIDAPAAVIVTKAADKTVNSCDLADQAAADAMFAEWLKTASVSGGCDPKSVPDVTKAPDYCGGSVKVTWTIIDKCYTATGYSATFTITAPPAVVVTKAADKTVNSCTLADQAAADAMFADWLKTASVSGGCDPKSVPDVTKAPEYCGGSVKVTWTITDKCYTATEYAATFTITAPPAVVVTKAADKTVNSCDLADQAAADAMFADWLKTASVSGGCDPKSVPDVTKAPEYCGGSVKVTWTITDKCYTTTGYSATFTITAPPAVVVTKAADKTVNACDVVDQAAADKLFADWLMTAKVSGGCDPKSVPDITTAPEYCGGKVLVTWTITDKCYTKSDYSATFTITAPPAVVVTKAADKTVNACDVADQAAADLMFADWLKTASVSGGCDPKSVPDVTKAPEYCGGSVKVNWTITDKCYTKSVYSATFTITAPSSVVVTKAVNKTIEACQVADQAAADKLFADWLATASVSGGCDPKSTPDISKGPDYCGGSVKVTWSITDKCYTSTSYSATFTIKSETPIVVTAPSDLTASGCQTITELKSMYDAWLLKAKYTGGCTVVLTNDGEAKWKELLDNYMYGGSVTVTWTGKDNCSSDTDDATFTVTSCCNTAYAYGGSASTCFIKDGFSNWGWTIKVTSLPVEFPLYAGAADCNIDKGMLVGTVKVSRVSASQVKVEYILNSGFGMTSAHIYIGADKYPLVKKVPTVSPGQYPYVSPPLNYLDHYTVNLSYSKNSFYIIVHANTCEKNIRLSPVAKTISEPVLRNKKAEVTIAEGEPTLNVYPNPFRNIVNFEISMTYNSPVRIEVYTNTGIPLGVILDENLLNGDIRKVEFDASQYPHTVFIYKVTTNIKTFSGTIMKAR